MKSLITEERNSENCLAKLRYKIKFYDHRGKGKRSSSNASSYKHFKEDIYTSGGRGVAPNYIDAERVPV